LTTDIASGAWFQTGSLGYGRLQRVAGVFINEIPRVDLTRSSFGADFYLWLRYAKDADPGIADPTDINFPNLMGGGFDHAHPAEQGRLPAGTEYRLWRVQGEFHNDFDLHRFPFDRQTLALSFFYSRAAADEIVYAIDKH
jgi:branched-chain amino acid transport system substrate-binding protein